VRDLARLLDTQEWNAMRIVKKFIPKYRTKDSKSLQKAACILDTSTTIITPDTGTFIDDEGVHTLVLLVFNDRWTTHNNYVLNEDVKDFLAGEDIPIPHTVTPVPSKERYTYMEIDRLIPNEYIINEYTVKPWRYRVDRYYPDYKLILECDQEWHKGYDQKQERQRMDRVNETLGTTDANWIRYNPDFSLWCTIRRIKEHICQHTNVSTLQLSLAYINRESTWLQNLHPRTTEEELARRKDTDTQRMMKRFEVP
jgi:hypothetical protein